VGVGLASDLFRLPEDDGFVEVVEPTAILAGADAVRGALDSAAQAAERTGERAGLNPSQEELFLAQAELAEGRSPLYAGLWRRFAHDCRVSEIVGPSPTWDAPLRLAAGLHYLVLTRRASWEAVDDALAKHTEFLREWVRERGVQTNEVQRSWTLMPCFLEAARRAGASEVDLVELGPAAGLNLVWDRYRYRYREGEWGDADAPFELAGDETRSVPADLLALRPAIRSRTGIDLNPIDVTSDEGALLLESFVWADQHQRAERLRAAVRAVRADPPRLIAGDIVEALPDVLEGLAGSGALTLVWESAVLGYVPAERRQLLHDTLGRFGRRHPLALVETGHASDGNAKHYGLTLQLWPGGRREELALATHHGDWLDWAAPGGRATTTNGPTG
jgi:hypothetical protein